MKAFAWPEGRTVSKHSIRNLPVALLGALLSALTPMVAHGQVDQGSITGTVQDSSGAVVANASVTVTNTDTGLALQVRTNAAGSYVFSPLRIGSYKVSAAAPGFQTTTRENVHLDIEQRLNVVLVLQPGPVSQTVTVSDAPPLLQTQEGTLKYSF